ncbi:MAG: peroxide stress protein YaaA [Burkholderiaceae bacterium]
MLFLLSPAKALDYETAPTTARTTQPQFLAQSAALIELLRAHSPQQVAQLMKLSDPLAALNVARFQAWKRPFNRKNAKQAVLAFNGDVYGGLDAASLDEEQLDWAQQHLAILSGLYGVLRPLDLMQPYRLEMGTTLATAQGSNLYQFWGAQISAYLNQRLQADKTPVVINLASQEYFKAVDTKALRARVVTCVFEEQRAAAGQGLHYKVISFMAKRARGLMARYAIEQRITTPEGLRGFAVENYAYSSAASQPDRLVFRRQAA